MHASDRIQKLTLCSKCPSRQVQYDLTFVLSAVKTQPTRVHLQLRHSVEGRVSLPNCGTDSSPIESDQRISFSALTWLDGKMGS